MAARPFDRRLTPARPDLAAAHLRGLVEAARFVEGERVTVRAPLADLRPRPDLSASIDTQATFGEAARLYETRDGFAFVQLERDSYVGYLPAAALGPAPGAPTHRVAVPLTFVYPAPDMKRPIVCALPLGARLAAVAEAGAWLRLVEGGFIFAAHAAPVEARAPDFVAVAEAFLDAPYLWGGKSAGGIDCSGLVQVSLDAAGIFAPRDADLQEKALGEPLPEGAPLARGDLIFWRGHVGIMRDGETLLHANGHHMQVASEALEGARARILATAGLEVSSARRLG
ncbi:NlpC/P60 family protein [Methylocella sp.]|uniref:C40 family peptidase n=1 Tax=Methylocella sp. TaxID=1978226 RepID=UPI003783D721